MRRLVLFVAVLVLAAPSLAQRPRTLTAEQVTCDRAQLAALAARTTVLGLDGGASPVVQSLFLTHSNRYGFYEGLVVGMPRFRPTVEPPLPGFGPGPEHQLGFHLNPSVRELLLNPARIPLAQVSMTREPSTSSLVVPGTELADTFGVQVRLRTTLGGDGAPGPGDAVIDNLAAPPPSGEGFRPADTTPGRGLVAAGLTEPCHTRRTDLDRRVLAILQRTLRVELWDLDRRLRYDTRIALFRDRSPGVFGADVYAVDPETGELLTGFLHLLVEAEAGGDGALRDGRLVVGGFDLPGNPRVEGVVRVVRPLFGGVESDYEAVVSGSVASPQSAVWELPFAWGEVLDGTAWNPSAPVEAECGQGTAAEIEATPRQDPDLEHMALVMGGGLTADPVVYARVVEDVGAIRADHPELPTVVFVGSWLPDEVLLGVEPATYDAMKGGAYHAWDCLNDWYGLEEIRFAQHSKDWLVLDFEGVYDVPALARDYRDLPDVLWAGPNSIAGDSSRLCGSIEGETYLYVVRQAGGDCPAGCTEEDMTLFTSEPGERPVLRDGWTTGDAEPRPPWAGACG